MVLCRCDCGTEKVQNLSKIKHGRTSSCGCLTKETNRLRETTHGCGTRGRTTPEYRSWKGMKERCRNPKSPNWKNYGGRGISICERWLKFENFLFDMGKCPFGKSIERINNNGNYCPENCKWATALEQQNNRRNNRVISFNGETMTVYQWGRKLNMIPETLSLRFKRWGIVSRSFEPIKR